MTAWHKRGHNIYRDCIFNKREIGVVSLTTTAYIAGSGGNDIISSSIYNVVSKFTRLISIQHPPTHTHTHTHCGGGGGGGDVLCKGFSV